MKRGPLFEKQVVDYLREVFGHGLIERRVRPCGSATDGLPRAGKEKK